MNRYARRPQFVWGGIVTVGIAVAVLFATAARPTSAQERADRISSQQRKGEPLSTRDISLDQARDVISAAVDKARQMNVKMNIAVVDAGGNLKGFARMDGACLGSIDIAQKKAMTSRFFDMPTGEVGKLSQPGKPLYQIEVSNGGLITFPGGVPLRASEYARLRRKQSASSSTRSGPASSKGSCRGA